MFNTFIDVLSTYENDIKKISLQPLPKLNNTKLNEEKNIESTTLPECESCYGAESAVLKCCPTCDDVKTAYRVKGWSFDPSKTFMTKYTFTGTI